MKNLRIPDNVIETAIKAYEELELFSDSELKEFKEKFKNEGTGIRLFKKMINDKTLNIKELYRIRSIINKHKKNKDKLTKVFINLHGGQNMVKFINKITKRKHNDLLLKNKLKRHFGAGREKRGQGVFSYSKLRIKKTNNLIHFY